MSSQRGCWQTDCDCHGETTLLNHPSSLFVHHLTVTFCGNSESMERSLSLQSVCMWVCVCVCWHTRCQLALCLRVLSQFIRHPAASLSDTLYLSSLFPMSRSIEISSDILKANTEVIVWSVTSVCMFSFMCISIKQKSCSFYHSADTQWQLANGWWVAQQDYGRVCREACSNYMFSWEVAWTLVL